MTDDDWAPLAENDLCQRPGEVVDVKKRDATPSLPAIATPAAAAPPAPAPLTAEQQRMLAELKTRIAGSREAASMLAQARRRREREERKLRALADPGLAATVVVGSDPFAQPAVDYDRGPDGRDEREESEWFRTLPPAEQERLHAAWRSKSAHDVGARAGQRRIARRRFVAAVVIFVAIVFAGTGTYWHATIGAGVVCGLWWRHAPADRFLDPLRALGCLFGMQSIAMLVHREPNMTLFMDSILLVALAAVVGFDGEIRRTGGFDVQ